MPPAFGGIDFGTSNSTVGIVADGRPRLVALEGEQATLPSAVFFNFEDNATRFGRRAIADYTDHAEGRLLRALKSVLGSSLIHEKTRIKSRSMPFSDIIGEFIGHLKSKLDAALGEPVDNVVLGRPVHFVDDDDVADAAAQDELGKAARAPGLRAYRVPVRADRRGARLRAVGDARGTGADRRHRRRHLGLLDRARLAGARATPRTGRTTSSPMPACMSAAPISTGCCRSRSVMPRARLPDADADGKRHLPAGYYVDLATWQRINLLYTPRR